VITLYQAEWCPYSAAVRERLTELGIDFVARQVEPREEERTEVDEIPTLVTHGGVRLEGTGPIFEYLATLEAWEHEGAHRAQYRAQAQDRRQEKTAKVLAESAPLSSAARY
jgi:glutathione S-transferase